MASSLELSDLTPELLKSDPRTWWNVVLENIDASGDRYPIYCDGCKRCEVLHYENITKCVTPGCVTTSCDGCVENLFAASGPGKPFSEVCNICKETEKKYTADLRKLTPEQKTYVASQIVQGVRDVFAIYCPGCDEIVMENGDGVTACSRCDLKGCIQCPELFSKWKESTREAPVCNACFKEN